MVAVYYNTVCTKTWSERKDFVTYRQVKGNPKIITLYNMNNICIVNTSVQTCSKTGIQYAPVLPVPFLALARTSLPLSAIGIEASWMGEGFSQPFSKMPISSSRLRQNSSNSLPRVSVTSCNKQTNIVTQTLYLDFGMWVYLFLVV